MMEKVLLTSDVINDEEHIFFTSTTNSFELYKFLIHKSFIETIRNALIKFQLDGIFVSDMFISISQYNNVVVGLNDNITKISSFEELLDINGIKLSVHIMVPERLKDNVKL